MYRYLLRHHNPGRKKWHLLSISPASWRSLKPISTKIFKIFLIASEHLWRSGLTSLYAVLHILFRISLERQPTFFFPFETAIQSPSSSTTDFCEEGFYHTMLSALDKNKYPLIQPTPPPPKQQNIPTIFWRSNFLCPWTENLPISCEAEILISEGINFLACMLALYKEQSMSLSLQRQHRKLSSFISKGGLVSDAPWSLLKPDQLSTTPAENGLKNVSFSSIQGNVKFLGAIWWTIQWATAIWRKSANIKAKISEIKENVHITWQWKGRGWCYIETHSLHKNQTFSRDYSPLSCRQNY